jgi:ferric-dicitrate binding protein FerR (iron transport regulator)
VVDDPELARRPVVGMFRANDADSFAQAACETFDAELIERNDTLHLRPRA